jgi:hypothetical protein
MKTNLTFVALILLTLLFLGCKKEKKESDCFKLQAIYLYEGDHVGCASDIWQVQKSPDKDIPVGTFVSFVTWNDPYPTAVKTGDVISIKLHMKVQIVPGIDPTCSYDYKYLLQGDFCD